MNKKIRIVVDTNIWVSYLIGKTLGSLTDKVIRDQIQLLFSDELLSEMIDVLHRDKFQKYFSPDNIQELLNLIHTKADFVEPDQQVSDCRDLKDNFLLDLCLTGQADYLITGDPDLLVLNPYHQTQILDYRQFSKVITLKHPTI